MATEKRLIDANALKWKLGQVTLYVPWLRFGKAVISKVLESYRRAVFEEIDNAPTVDAVEVVRCKDCKEYYKGKCENVLGLPNPYPYSYCPYGERKNNA